jgi:hypothetical protein
LFCTRLCRAPTLARHFVKNSISQRLAARFASAIARRGRALIIIQ